jgi:hypothetical protein
MAMTMAMDIRRNADIVPLPLLMLLIRERATAFVQPVLPLLAVL